MDYKTQIAKKTGIHEMIVSIRGQRVMLDSDLAAIFGVPTMRLNEQFKRNRKRFPSDFAFQLEPQEVAILISQNAISRSHGGRRTLPWVFTEHGAIMLATILNSPVAVEASVRIVRAFVFMREQFMKLGAINPVEVLKKLAELEGRVGQHDKAIALIFTALKGLFEPPVPAAEEPRRQIGFQVRETPARYGTRPRKIHYN